MRRITCDAGLGDMTTTDCEHIVALDALAVIVHPNNPISELSKAQLAQIFGGQITDLSRVSGYGNPIRVHSKRGFRQRPGV